MERARFNPFPGLRPFEPDEDHLFFGREKESDELLRRLRSTRFLSVVGTSGSGKSSLVRSGLIPSLQSGLMAGAGSGWRIAILRPGDDPIGNLAAALDAPDVLGAKGELETVNRVLLEATLRRGRLGLVGAVRQARMPAHDNLLVIVDQFEEIFRFRRSRSLANSRDEAVAFVKILLEASRQIDVPIYVVLTMRSDFVGDCMEFPGLPEAVSTGQYLVPRMTRDELRAAIAGPVAVGGGTIAPRLIPRLLNDLGDDQDQLPVLQHVLMRTWDYWQQHGAPGEPIDVADYEAVGTLREALSRHAEEAYVECGPTRQELAERVFKALTDTVTDPRGVRRPTSVADLTAICEASEAEVIALVEIFRRTGRSFLMPPAQIPLTSKSIVDVSHESLMRCWTRLISWADEERSAAAFYRRLSQAAAWHDDGTAGLWHNPQLEMGLRWQRENRPTAAWAARYNASFDRAIAFLELSEQERTRLEAERERAQRRKLQQARWAAGILASLLALAVVIAYVAWSENTRAEKNLQLARDAVDQTLASVEVDPARMGADVPQMEEFRRQMLERTKRFYSEFIEQSPNSEELYRENAMARQRLGHIDRMLARSDDAVREYSEAIAQFERLARDHPRTPEYREALAGAYNWLGETLRPVRERAGDAENAYDNALRLQEALTREAPAAPAYQRQLARTHYNRGILRSSTASPGDPQFASAEADFREAIRLLEPVAATSPDRMVKQDLARACNNLGTLVAEDDTRLAEARTLYERAVAIDEALVKEAPDRRQIEMELATFANNLAALLDSLEEYAPAMERTGQALALLEDLARPAPSLGVGLADTHNLRGRFLQSQGSAMAIDEYRQSLEAFVGLADASTVRLSPEFHLRFGDLLLNLAALGDRRDTAEASRLLVRATDWYIALASRSLRAGSARDADAVLENVSQLLPLVSEAARTRLATQADVLRDAVRHAR